MFTGLSAFPLTPMNDSGIDEKAFIRLLKRLTSARVDSIGVLGSTGSYIYLNREERLRVIQLVIEHAEGIPVMIGISALRTRDVLHLAENAQKAGANGVLLAPVSYQQLTEDDLVSAKERVVLLRANIPSDVTIGVSGDAYAATGLNAGCDAWYSVLGGLYPDICIKITRSALTGHSVEAESQSARLDPLWKMYQKYGSLRVVAAVAEMQGLIDSPSLPLPLQGLNEEARQALSKVLINL